MLITTITPPSVEPLSLGEIKLHLRLTNNDHNILMERYMKAAREMTEAHCNRAFVQRTLEQQMDEFKDEILLGYPPLNSVTSVKYIDTDGVEQTLSTTIYDTDTNHEPGRITLAYNQSWPSIRDQVNAVKIRFVAGYDSGGSPDDLAANIPNEAIVAMLLLIGHWFKNAEATTDLKLMSLPLGYDALLASLKNWGW
jgi:uncharacterized phiE125 gp8 family phage protein